MKNKPLTLNDKVDLLIEEFVQVMDEKFNAIIKPKYETKRKHTKYPFMDKMYKTYEYVQYLDSLNQKQTTMDLLNMLVPKDKK
jgi:hypothetical protein